MRALIAFVVAATVGAMVFIFIQVSSVSKSGVSVGMRKAEASCTDEGKICLPGLTMIDTEGNAWTPEQLHDKVVVINFWATWCAPCKSEVPDLARIYSRFHDKDVIMLGLMTDQASEAGLASFRKQFGLNYPVVRVDDELAMAFGYPSALPTTFVYNRAGHLEHEQRGGITESQLEGVLLRLLSE